MDSQTEKFDNSEDINSSKCNICYEDYENGKTTLECGHSLCKKCIIGVVKPTLVGNQNRIYPDGVNSHGWTITCPFCRKVTSTNLAAITKSVNDSEELIELFKKFSDNKQDRIICDNCHILNAEHSCFECDIKLCEKCWPDIHKIGKLLQHRKNNLLENVKDLICSHHPKYYKEFICMHADCAQNPKNHLMCIICERTSQHKGHETELISNLAPKYRSELNNQLMVLNNKIKNVADTLVHLNGHSEENIDKLLEDVNKKIERHYAIMLAILIRSQTIAHREAAQLINDEKNTILKQRVELYEYLINSIDLSQEIEKYVNDASDNSIASNYFEQLEKLSNVHQQDINLEKTIVRPIQISIKPISMLQDIEITLKPSGSDIIHEYQNS